MEKHPEPGAGAGGAVEAERAQSLTLEELYDRFGSDLYGYACALSGSRAEAEEAVQEVFVKIAERLDRLDEVEDLRAYLFVALRNEVFRGGRRLRLAKERDLAGGALRFVEAATGLAGDETELLARVLAELPKEQREAVYLRIWGSMTFGQVAEHLGIPPDTAASRYRYGIEKLRQAMGRDA